ncbi:hypothetical protein [Actinomadura parmotrematis]|uniref:Uncharacterized protein n=1 Tax=Actinomadura parmotrematis TaxID=2864039 RepID=A0ABS7FU88_9ACTN|nr:hypothetical protein [Actinomadura parmotrematis]MBW8483886.1 hypothetical protein [Actinomadura parmotrematis]
MSPYIDRLAERLTADGCEVAHETVGGVPATVGYRANWVALSRIHLFVMATHLNFALEEDMARFTHAAKELAKQRKGELRGLQSGVAVIAVLVTEDAEERAKALARRPFALERAVLAQPALVSLAERRVHTFRKHRALGALPNAYLRRKNRLYLPDPEYLPEPR